MIFALIFIFARGFVFADDDLDGNDDGNTDYGAGWQGGDDDDSSSDSGGYGGSSSADDSESSGDSGDSGNSGLSSGGEEGESYDDENKDSSDPSGNSGGENAEEIPSTDDLEGFAFVYDGEVYVAVQDADGYHTTVTFSDVYDKDGNFIFVYEGYGDRDAINARLVEVFSGMIVLPDMDSFTALSLYIDACRAYDEAKRSGKDAQTLEELELKVAAAQSVLDRCTRAEGYTWAVSDKHNFGVINDKEGKTVFHAGDPVIFASGDFIIKDRDISYSSNKSYFELKRHYSSGQSQCEQGKFGIFGRGWSSNIETRIVAGYSQDFIDALPSWEKYMERLDESEKKIAQYAEEDSDCVSYYEKILSLKENSEIQYEQIKAYAEKSEKIKEKNARVLYGRAKEYAPTVGLDTLIYCQDDGTFLVFQKNDDGSFSLKDDFKNCRVTLTSEEDGYCVSYLATGEKRYFSDWGLPLRFTYKNGGQVDFVYDDDLILRYLKIDGKKSFSFNWSEGRLSSVKDEISGKSVSYGYSDGYLVSVKDYDGDVRSFEYDDDGLISKQIKSDGSFVLFEFSEIGGKRHTVKTVNEEGASEYFNYKLDDSSTIYTDYDGISTLFRYDERGRTLREEHSDGFFTDYEYDDCNRLLSKTDNFGKTSFLYDEDGGLIQKTYPDGTCEKWSYCEGGVASFTDRDGISQQYFYDFNNQLTDIYKASSLIVHFDYDDDGKIDCSTDSFGNKTKFSYDYLGNVTQKSVFAPDSSIASVTEKWTYDSQNRIKTYTDALGRKTEYKYKSHGVEIEMPDSLKIEESYSSRKQLLSKSMTDENTGEKRTLSYDYDKNKRLTACYVSGTDSTGTKFEKAKLYEIEYTNAGNVKKYIEFAPFSEDSSCLATDYSYGTDGNVEKASRGFYDSDSGSFLSSTLDFRHTVSYTEGGRLFTKINDDGSLQVRMTDSEGRLLYEGENDIWKTVNEYSGAGRLLRSKKGNSGFVEYQYNSVTGDLEKWREDGGTISTFFSSASDEEYFYDERKNLVKIKSASGAKERTFDGLNRLTSEIIRDNSGKIIKEDEWIYSDSKVTHVSGGKYKNTLILNAFGETVEYIDGLGNKKTYTRDLLGRIVTETDFYGAKKQFKYGVGACVCEIRFPDGSFLKFGYDALLNCTSASDNGGTVWKKTYDSRGRLKTFSQRPFFTTESYEYDEYDSVICVKRNGSVVKKESFSSDGKKFEFSDALGNKYLSACDGFGRLLSQKNPLGKVSETQYFSDGRPSFYKDFNGNTMNYSYSSDGLSMKIAYSDGDFVFYEYDASGNMISAKNDSSDISFSYDTAGFLLSQTDGRDNMEISYTYDLCGNLTKISAKNRTTSYSWGKNSELLSASERITQETEIFSSKVRFVYDKMGREILRVYDSGESVKSSYDTMGRLVLLLGYDSSMSLVFVDGSLYDENGTKKYSLDSDFLLTAYDYDEYGRLTKVSYPYKDSVAKKMKAELSGAGLYFLEGSERLSMMNIPSKDYEALQKLCSQIGFGSYQISATSSVLTETFSYDENNNIVSRTTPFGTIKCTYDARNALVSWGNSGVAEYDQNGNMTRRKTKRADLVYEYGPSNRIKSVTVLDSENDSRYERKFTYDALGRKILEWSNEEGLRKNSYIGLTMRLFESRKMYSNDFPDYTSASTVRTKSISDSSYGRYVFIGEEFETESKSYAVEESPYGISPSYDSHGRVMNYFSSGASSGDGNFILMTDEAGSVRAGLDPESLPSVYDYDAFGFPLGTSSQFGFIGKRFDSKAALYDFGFRDYEPSNCRFSSPDPIYDGMNWYSYCDGNPVTFLDKNGLEALTLKEQIMQDMGDALLGDSTKEYAKDSGCLVTAIAEALTAFTGIEISNEYVNSLKECFNGAYIDWEETCDMFGLSRNMEFEESKTLSTLYNAFDIYESMVIVKDMSVLEVKNNLLEENPTQLVWAYNNYLVEIEHSAKVSNTLTNIKNSTDSVAVIARVCYDINEYNQKPESGLHFVGIGTEITSIGGKNYVSITATSLNDKSTSLGTNRTNTGWLVQDGKVYVPLSCIQRIDTISKNL